MIPGGCGTLAPRRLRVDESAFCTSVYTRADEATLEAANRPADLGAGPETDDAIPELVKQNPNLKGDRGEALRSERPPS
jgi:hypothetical protein